MGLWDLAHLAPEICDNHTACAILNHIEFVIVGVSSKSDFSDKPLGAPTSVKLVYFTTSAQATIRCVMSLKMTLLKLLPQPQGAVSIRKTVLPGMAIPMLKIRRPNGRLIFNMEIAIRR